MLKRTNLNNQKPIFLKIKDFKNRAKSKIEKKNQAKIKQNQAKTIENHRKT